MNISVPLLVSSKTKHIYLKNYETITRSTGKLFLFAGDQKIEHLNQDFYGPGIAKQCAQPHHLFNIAQSADIGAFATQIGMISRYAQQGDGVPYIVKMNSKTNIVSTQQSDPISLAHTSVDQIVQLRDAARITIVGVGYTIYLGSDQEQEMIIEAARIIQEAHEQGLVTVLWIYPRGQAVANEKAANIIAGAAGVATALGADFVKVNPPQAETVELSAQLLQQASAAAGTTGVICSGGSKIAPKELLSQLHTQLKTGNASGCAVGRNVHQHTLQDAQKLCKAISALVYQDVDISAVHKMLE